MFCRFSVRAPRLISFLVITVIAFAVLFPISLWAQDASTGALRGTVLDAHGAAIVSADVMAVRIENGLRYHVVTDGQGRYIFDLLPPGSYVARAEAEKMTPQNSPQLRVEVGASVELNFKLPVAGRQETVTVADSPQGAEVQASSLSSMVDERAISDLPQNGRRFTDLSLLAPGVTQDPRGLDSSSNGDLSYGGIRGYQSSYLVDGADNNNGFFAQARGRYRAPYQFSNEVVQEFRISSNSYGAEMGRAGGAVVNVVTKSGTNSWHGSGFYFLRDSALDATPAFLASKPGDQRHQFGGTMGGPIKRDKAFIFAGFDQHLFYVPAIVQFVDGTTVVTPQANDYEDSDKVLVFAAAAQLSKVGGTFHAKQIGNTGFLKLDYVLTPHQYLSARLSTSRYWGANNVFLDASSPITNYATSGNGEEDARTESASLALISGLTPKLTSHLRVQFSRDLQQSFPNSTDVRTRIYDIIDAFGQSSILPRQTREHRLHVAETLSFGKGRHNLKFGGDTMFTRDYNYFPSLFGGEYIFDNISVDPWTFKPMPQGMQATPLRAYAHDVPRYYLQNFGSPISHPNSNDYAAFAQDTIRLTNRLSLSLGVRYDLQTFSSPELVSNPLWPAAGKMPSNSGHFAPRAGIAYAIGNRRPLMVRAGFGIFYTRLPQMYQSSVINNNGLHNGNLFLDNADQSEIFPAYPNPLVNCVRGPVPCFPPDSLKQFLTGDISAFAPNFKTPKVQQASLSLEKELGDRFIGGVSYLYVHGVDLIRARDVNLPPPVQYSYPVFDPNGNFLNTYYTVNSFATWQRCGYGPCLGDVVRPIPELGAINQFESASSSVYHGLTASVQRRIANGVYFRLAYTYSHAIDSGQDALVTGGPVTVQNSYAPNSERGPSVTDQRHRLSISGIIEPHPFEHDQAFVSKLLNNWKMSGMTSFGSGRPVDATIYGDPNRDDNSDNDRLPSSGRNAFRGPDYATTDLRLTRKIKISECCHMEMTAEAFNIFNRDNKRQYIFDRGMVSNAADFIRYARRVDYTYYPAYFQQSADFMTATRAFAPRQVQLALRFIF